MQTVVGNMLLTSSPCTATIEVGYGPTVVSRVRPPSPPAIRAAARRRPAATDVPSRQK